ncbi:uncharacterized protein LOC135373463 [Ornithodoros turicata]|uniref:uncharacterized protein LOC135373463 n=1 Tax=Ornithodoros turicata TaxID=34597 RepID=UPI0031388892
MKTESFNTSNFSVFRAELLEQLNRRFEATLKDSFLIAACILNPRINLRIFESRIAKGLSKPSTSEAVKVVEHLLDGVERAPYSFTAASVTSAQTTSKPDAKVDISKVVGLYGVLDAVYPLQEARQLSELERYLSAEYDARDVLSFWRNNFHQYPKLGRLAQVCLGIPATSGAVERLFSVAGALQRARRASLVPSTIEDLILVSEHVRKNKN